MKKTPTGLIVGLIFILLGILYAGSALDIFHFSIFFPGFWTLFIIVPSFYALFKPGQDKTAPIIGLVIGFCFLINAQHISLHIDFWPMFLAIICIVIGARLIFPKKFSFSSGSNPKEFTKEFTREFDNRYQNDGRGYINASSLFSGKEIRLDNEVFYGGNLSAVFGAIELDLRNAVITEDVKLNVSAIFGGIDIYVPSNVRVLTENLTPLFGGVDVAHTYRSDSAEASPAIHISGTCLFGGVEVH